MSMNTTVIARTRRFSVSPSIIYSLIKAQAGTLAKGILECVMNSVDAGASSIAIELNRKKLVVSDNGKGFRDQAEIEACFEVFGFEHKEGDRAYGQFGIGRAQLWNFCSTVWRTNGFRMAVDIKNKGLDYDLTGDAEPYEGLRIEGSLYEPLSTSDVLACERELKELATYVSIPLTFNGELISKDASLQKWSHESDDAWVAVSSVSKTLTVYNLGVKVREYPAYQFGVGGLVVTKPGVRLSLNMARNDILLAECQVWRRIRPFLQRKSDEAVQRSARLTEEQLTNLATRFLSGELPYGEIAHRKFFQDLLSKKYTIAEAMNKVAKSLDRVVTYVPQGGAVPIAEETHKRGDCVVLSHQVLQRFNVRSMQELFERLPAAVKASDAMAHRLIFGRLMGPEVKNPMRTMEDWRGACTRIREGYTDIPASEWTPKERAALAVLQGRYNYSPVAGILRAAGVVDKEPTSRTLRVGLSEVAQAWTDGTQVITFNRECLARMDQGLSGVMHVLSVLLHEYLHEGPSTGTHVHDAEFYERFHAAALHFPSGNRWSGSSLGAVAEQVLRQYLLECRKRKVAVPRKVLTSLDVSERVSLDDMSETSVAA